MQALKDLAAAVGAVIGVLADRSGYAVRENSSTYTKPTRETDPIADSAINVMPTEVRRPAQIREEGCSAQPEIAPNRHSSGVYHAVTRPFVVRPAGPPPLPVGGMVQRIRRGTGHRTYDRWRAGALFQSGGCKLYGFVDQFVTPLKPRSAARQLSADPSDRASTVIGLIQSQLFGRECGRRGYIEYNIYGYGAIGSQWLVRVLQSCPVRFCVAFRRSGRRVVDGHSLSTRS